MPRQPHLPQIVEGPAAARPGAAQTPGWLWYLATDDGGGSIHRPAPDGWHRVTPPVPGEWQTPTLQNSWSAGTPAPQYRIGAGTVQVRGAVSRPTGTFPSVVFTLPLGYRPSVDARLVLAVSGGVAHAVVGANGDVTVTDAVAGAGASSNAGLWLDGITLTV